MRAAMLILTLVATASLCACAGRGGVSQGPPATLRAEQYPAAFESAVEVLRELGFQPTRIDARAGVVASAPEPSAGLLTPWSRGETTLMQELEGAVHRQQRTVRISFGPVTDASAPPVAPGSQVDAAAPQPPVAETVGPIAMTVTVYLERVERTGQRLDPTSIRLSSVSEDRVLAERGMWPAYTVSRERDTMLEIRIETMIAERATTQPPA